MEVGRTNEDSLDFAFAINNPIFSDKILQLRIVDVESDDKSNGSDFEPSRRIIPTAEPRLKTVHVNCLILAARSPFFRNLFSNGMLETEHKHVTLQIGTSEEVSFMDLLKYVYTNDLPTTWEALLDLLVIADKFEVVTCLRDCSRALQDVPMTCELASAYLNLPPCLVMSPTVKPLVDAAKKFLVKKYKDLDKFKEEVLNLPLLSIQAILSSDEVQTSECAVYDFVLTWARKHYPDVEERRGILKTQLLHLIRFPFMTTRKLTEEVLTCNDIDPEVASKIVIRALGFKAETPHRKRCLAAEESNAASRQFVERAYKLRPIKMVELTSPHQHYIVYFDLTKNEVMYAFHGDQVRSETFHLEGLALTFAAKYSLSQNIFLLSLEMVRSTTCTVDCVFSLRRNPSQGFEIWAKDSVPPSRALTSASLPITTLLGDGGVYFVNNVFHVRVVITIKK